MRFIIRCLATLGMLLPAARSAGQIPAPTAAPEAQVFAAPQIEPPSEAWQPPAADSNPIGPSAPAAELPLPGLHDQVTGVAPDLVVEQPSPWHVPMLWLGPAPWDSGIELGVNGSSGTSESVSLRTGMYIRRESRFSKLDFSAYYNLTMNGGEATQNNAQLDVTHDWLIDESSPWTLFLANDVFYDEFAAFNLETNVNTGVGYRFIHRPDLDLIARVGGGASRDFGGPDDHWAPESLVGFEYAQRITQTQKFYGKLDYFPQWDNVGEYRLMADTGWEIELVQPSNLSLKISATDRYDSTPEGVNPHLVNYSVLLLLKL